MNLPLTERERPGTSLVEKMSKILVFESVKSEMSLRPLAGDTQDVAGQQGLVFTDLV